MAKKFSSLGKINAFEKPVEFEYKPLGLESFAQPLAQMQQRYDVTEQSIDEAKFGIENLNPDDTRSKAISEKLEKDKQDVLLELERTGNAKQAAKALRGLNTFWNEDVEVAKLRTNRAKHLQDIEEAKKRVDEKKINKEDADKEQIRQILKYDTEGGAGSREKVLEGKGVSIGSFDIHDNLEEDLMKFSEILAKGTPLWEDEKVDPELIKIYEKFGGDGIALTTRKWRDKEQVATEVYNFVTLSDRYRDFLTNRAERDAYLKSTPPTQNTGNPYYDPNFTENQILSTERSLQNNLAIAKHNNDPREVKQVENAINNFRTATDNAINTGAEKQLAENLYVQSYGDDFTRKLSHAASDLHDVNKITSNFTKLDDGKGKASKRLEMPNGLELNTQLVETNRTGFTADELKTPAGTAVSDTPNQSQVSFKEFSTRLHTEPDETKDLEGTALTIEPVPITNSTITGIKSTFDLGPIAEAVDFTREMLPLHASWTNIAKEEQGYAELKNNLDAEIADLNGQLDNTNVNLDEDERTKYKAERTVARQERRNLQIQRQSLFASLLTDVEQSINDMVDGPKKRKLLKSLQAGGLRGVSGELTMFLDMTLTDLGESIKTSLTGAERLNATNSSQEQINSSLLYIKKDNEYNIKATREELDEYENVLKTINAWDTRLNAAGVPSTRETLIDDNLKKATNGVSERLKKEVKEFSSQTPGASIVGRFNPSTGDFTADKTNQSYDMSLYNIESLRLLGVAQGPSGQDITAVSVDRTKESTDAQFDALLRASGGGIKAKDKEKMKMAYLNGTEYSGEGKQVFDQVISDLEKTPKTLTLGLSGYSFSLDQPLQLNTIDFIKEGIQRDNPTIVANSINNYASVGVSLNSQRLKDYNEKAAKLKNIATSRDANAFIAETTPASYYVAEENGTYSSFVVEYKYSKDDARMVAEVSKHYYDQNMNPVNTGPVPFAKHFINDFGSPSALYAIDLLYGVGGASNLLIDEKGRAFIPANMVTKEQLHTYVK